MLQQKGISGSIPDFANLIATPKREGGGGGGMWQKKEWVEARIYSKLYSIEIYDKWS